MKEGIHPTYKKTVCTCACGNSFETSSTRENLKVEICSKCHPFFSGQERLVDQGGQVDKFRKRFGLNQQK